MGKEKFNPNDEKYKKVEDLPSEHQEEFVLVEGGFVRKEAVETFKAAEEDAELSRRGIGWGPKSTIGQLKADALQENYEREISPLETKEKENGTMEEHKVLCFTARSAGLNETKYIRVKGTSMGELRIFTLLKKIGDEYVPDENKKTALWNFGEWEIVRESSGLNGSVKTYTLFNPKSEIGYLNGRDKYLYIDIFTDTLLPGKDGVDKIPPEEKFGELMIGGGGGLGFPGFGDDYLKRLRDRDENITRKSKKEIKAIEKEIESKEKEKGLIEKADILCVSFSKKNLWHIPLRGEAKMFKTVIKNERTGEEQEKIEVDFLGKVFEFKDKRSGLDSKVETWEVFDQNNSEEIWVLYTSKTLKKGENAPSIPSAGSGSISESQKEYLSDLFKKSRGGYL